MSLKLISIEEMNRLVEICRVLAQAPFYQKLGPGGVLAIYLTAREMGLPPMFCLNGGLHNIEGKVVLSGQLINMMLVNAGWEIEFVEMNEKCCHLKFHYPQRRRVEEFRYTIEDAKKAGYLGIPGPNGTYQKKPKDNWIYHPLDMLFNRCITSGGRKYAPTVLGNCYGVGELDGDDYIMPVGNPKDLPAVADQSTQQNPNIAQDTQPKAIEHDQVRCDALDQFRKRHNIVQGQPIYDYVVRISNQKKVNVDTAMELALKNEATFLKAFSDMQAKQATNDLPKSTELVETA